jgi:hypothetical protein
MMRIHQICSPLSRLGAVKMQKSPNQTGCTEPRNPSQLYIGHHWRGVGEPGRYTPI